MTPSKIASREERIAIFEDTMEWIQKDPVLSASVMEAKKRTEVFDEHNYPAFHRPTREEKITVTRHRSFEAAMKLHKENPIARIAVMNFASAIHPGGGVQSGSGAQEECLCRCSTLYPLLDRESLRKSFYQRHYNLHSSKATDTLIYTEGVVVCKTDTGYPERMPPEDWFMVDVMTVAAPDLRRKSNPYAELLDNGAVMNDAELFGYHVRRAIHMLTVAASKGADILVLGAFGCGAFQNNPEVVAKAYQTALLLFPKVFQKVEFAVFCKPEDPTNYDAFQRTFQSWEKPDTPKATPVNENLTEMVFILDRSGSMAPLVSDTIGGYNSLLEKQKKEKGEAKVTTVLFDDSDEVICDNQDIRQVEALTDKVYYARGSTALLDAIGKTITTVSARQKNHLGAGLPAKTVVVIMTDGMENASHEYRLNQIKQMIDQQQKEQGWEFLFMGANIDAVKVAGSMGIAASRAANYRADALGTATNFDAVCATIAGVRSTGVVSDHWKDKIDQDYASRKK